jgi:protein arginine N-methyltransferase 1
VDPAQVCTQPCLLQTFDIKTMKKEDACFTAPFSLVATRNDYAHALVAYFDVSFNDCHKPVGFSTAPRCRATHWKQTVFYLKDTLILHQGDTVKGQLQCAPNAKNPRDLDIEVTYEMEGRKGAWAGKQEYRLR